jgi:hypothetical protein
VVKLNIGVTSFVLCLDIHSSGIGFTMAQLPVRSMCLVLDAKDLAAYSVVHSRSLELEGWSGFHILSRVCGFGRCNRKAAL